MSTPEQVRQYYNEFTASYLQIYGDVIQAFRPTDTAKLLDYVGRNAGVNWKFKVLDVGCGVAGPAIYFAQKWNTYIDGITISETQFQLGNEKIQAANLTDNIFLHLGDYHKMDTMLLPDVTYDVVLFLESLGHSNQVEKAIHLATNKLKSGGTLYIKDFYKKHIHPSVSKSTIDKVIANINQSYCYNTLDLQEVKTALINQNLQIDFIRPFEFIDDIQVRKAFEIANKIDTFEGMPEFYPADWLEIKCTKL